MLASIDVGTNTLRLLLGDVHGNQVIPADYVRRITRLGGQFNTEKGLAPESMERTFFALKEFSLTLQKAAVSGCRVVGTQALRQAPNSQGFVQRIFDLTGFKLEIISGDEEARLSAAGVLSALRPIPESCLIFDIGGGSTEFILWSKGRLRYFRSFPLGVVRLAEDCDGPQSRQSVVSEIIDRLLVDLEKQGLAEEVLAPQCALVGTAGTVTTLAALDLEMARYDWRRVNNHPMSASSLQAMMARLAPMDIHAREQLAGMEKGRGDLIVPGLEIVLALIGRLGKPHLTVSDFGLLEGVLLSLPEAQTMG